MSDTPVEAHLSQIASRWSLLQPAADPARSQARRELLVHYHEAVYHYLLRKLRDPHAAGDLFSNFAVRLLEEDALLRRVDPSRGRFRDFLKVVLSRMVIDHYRKLGRAKPVRLDDDRTPEPASPEEDADPEFVACWRQEILEQTWKALQAAEARTGQPYATAFRLKEEQPGLRSQQIAEQLSQKHGKPYKAANVRQIIHRGRDLFGDLLVAEVARSLQAAPDETVSVARIEDELIELGLLFSYCRDALARRAAKG